MYLTAHQKPGQCDPRYCRKSPKTPKSRRVLGIFKPAVPHSPPMKCLLFRIGYR